MELRGTRECTACGKQWSYYETGEIACPSCDSLRSVGIDERRLHTAGTETLDLTPLREAVETTAPRELARDAVKHCRKYCKTVGFVHAGELQPLDDTYLAAMELRRVGTTLGNALSIDDDEQAYLLELLRIGDEGERPAPETVPESLHAERGLAVAASVDTYLTDLRRTLDEHEAAVDSVLSNLTAHRKRIEALDGQIDPATSEQLVESTRDLSAYLCTDDETALARAQERSLD